MNIRWTCLLCGRDKFDRPGQPHRCQGGFRKRFKAEDVFAWKETELTGIKFWTAEPRTHVVYRIFQKNETVFQCYLTTGSSYQFCKPITEDLDSFAAAEAACISHYHEQETPLPEPGGD